MIVLKNIKKMSKIPTVEKFLRQSKSLHDMWDNTRGKGEWDEKAITKSHIEFAKMHVEEALKEASRKVVVNNYRDEGGIRINKNSILNAYPLENIK